MAVRFPKEGNEYWPLPPDYPSLDGNGQRLARLNACFLQQTPEDYVAAWSFFRSHYLFPPATPVGMFYRHGVQPSPPSHYQVTHDQMAYQLCAFAAPRSFAKSTLLREWNLLELLTKAHWEIIIFLAKDQFVSEQISLYKALLETNARIIDDFGWYWRKTVGVESLRPKRGTGMWSNHQIQLTTGSMVTGLSITGRALGKRPHVIRFDDVEKDDSLVKEPSDRIEAFRNMLLNVVYPMAEEGCRITVIGTLLSRRSFLYWMMKTADVRIEDHWHRTLLAVQMDGKDLWREKMGPEWQERQKAAMGVTAYRAQYMNDPGTEADRVLRIHDDLCTYSIDTPDQASVDSPLNSVAVLSSHQLQGREGGGSEGRPIPKRITRPLGASIARMYRFVTVDWAPTTSDTSDYSGIHVMGLENTPEFRDTLWSLELWLGKCRQHELVRHIYRLAMKWQVRVVGVEAFGPYMELYERLREDLPGLCGLGTVPPAVLPLRFPPYLEKADRIKGLEWRFDQFRVKLPRHLKNQWPYRELWRQIENFTDDLALLEHDDAIDTLAMHQAIAKPHKHAVADVAPGEKLDPIEMLRAGRSVDEATGLGVILGMDLGTLPAEVLFAARDRHHKRLSEDPANFATWVQMN